MFVGRMEGWMGEEVVVWMTRKMSDWMEICVGRRVNECRDGWLDGWTDESDYKFLHNWIHGTYVYLLSLLPRVTLGVKEVLIKYLLSHFLCIHKFTRLALDSFPDLWTSVRELCACVRVSVNSLGGISSPEFCPDWNMLLASGTALLRFYMLGLIYVV